MFHITWQQDCLVSLWSGCSTGCCSKFLYWRNCLFDVVKGQGLTYTPGTEDQLLFIIWTTRLCYCTQWCNALGEIILFNTVKILLKLSFSIRQAYIKEHWVSCFFFANICLLSFPSWFLTGQLHSRRILGKSECSPGPKRNGFMDNVTVPKQHLTYRKCLTSVIFIRLKVNCWCLHMQFYGVLCWTSFLCLGKETNFWNKPYLSKKKKKTPFVYLICVQIHVRNLIVLLKMNEWITECFVYIHDDDVWIL